MQGIRSFRGGCWPLETLHRATSNPPGNVSVLHQTTLAGSQQRRILARYEYLAAHPGTGLLAQYRWPRPNMGGTTTAWTS
jgi:hypothetical protein